MWSVYVECLCGVSMWSVYVECLCGVSMWSVYVECLCGVSMWSVIDSTSVSYAASNVTGSTGGNLCEPSVVFVKRVFPGIRKPLERINYR